MSYIQLNEVSKKYKSGQSEIIANDKISFSLDEGRLLIIVGASGAGKTTLLNIIGGMEKASSGDILIDGKNLSKLNENELTKYRRDDVGFVFQHYNLIPNLTALENVELPLIYSSVPKEERHKRANELLEMVGLKERTHHRPNELSGGQRQRVAIARALVNNPSIILADEPTGNLDSKSEGEIIEILQKLNKMGKTIVIVTHEPSIGEIAERKIVFKDGEII